MTIDSEKLEARIDEAVLQARRFARESGKNVDYENGRASGLELAKYYLEDLADHEREMKRVRNGV